MSPSDKVRARRYTKLDRFALDTQFEIFNRTVKFTTISLILLGNILRF